MKRFLVILILLAPVAALVIFSCFDLLPARGLTGIRMETMKQRILHYARTHNELPKTAADLPLLTSRDNTVQDGWGRDIRFEIATNGIVTLTSLGRDGRPGGTGDDADITRAFPAHNPQGGWSEETVAWSAESLVK